MNILHIHVGNEDVQGVALKRIAKRARMYEAVGILHTQRVVPHILTSMRAHPTARKVQTMGLYALSAIVLHTAKLAVPSHIRPHMVDILALAEAAKTMFAEDREVARHTKALLARLL